MYVFRTRLPVAINCIATVMLPLDLHVLSLPLAFILSQDQTLHCKCCLMLTLLIQRINVSNRIVFALTYLLSRLLGTCCCFPTFKDLLAFLRFAQDDNHRYSKLILPPIFWECKCTSHIILSQNFFKDFSRISISLRELK